MNRKAALIWGTASAGLLAYDVFVCDRRKDDSTLSCVTRWVVGTVPGGRVLFPLALVWFHQHIDRPLVAAARLKEV